MKKPKKFKLDNFFFYSKNIIRLITPNFFFSIWLKNWLKDTSFDQEMISKRVSYYISPLINTKVQEDWIPLKEYKLPKKGSKYFFDLLKYVKYFSKNKKIKYKFGDVTKNFEVPTIVKSRPINHNGNSVIMKLDALRHFNFIADDLNFKNKSDHIVWRGEIHNENRKILVQKFYDHPLCNIGIVSQYNRFPNEWSKDFKTPKEQLKYKFIISAEGIDVATNLKWIMGSNSLCFMPTPKYETWFMEGKLIPNYHYVHLKDDYSDLIEKRNYYLENEDKALEIIKNANHWVQQFQNKKLEKLISIRVLQQYFELTNQQ